MLHIVILWCLLGCHAMSVISSVPIPQVVGSKVVSALDGQAFDLDRVGGAEWAWWSGLRTWPGGEWTGRPDDQTVRPPQGLCWGLVIEALKSDSLGFLGSNSQMMYVGQWWWTFSLGSCHVVTQLVDCVWKRLGWCLGWDGICGGWCF